MLTGSVSSGWVSMEAFLILLTVSSFYNSLLPVPTSFVKRFGMKAFEEIKLFPNGFLRVVEGAVGFWVVLKEEGLFPILVFLLV